MKKIGLKEKFRYWLDSRMAKGTGSMMWLLAYTTVAVILILVWLRFLLGLGEGDPFAALWDTVAYTINAWVPFSGDGSPGSLVLMAVAAVAGLLITSTLISIITAGIEDKLTEMRKGTSLVLEKGHTVVLGFNTGAYQLIRELCLARPGEKKCIIIADGTEKDEMEECLRNNIEIPREVKLICRSIDVRDSVQLQCCAIHQCRTVIINESDDVDTVKTLLAVSALLRAHPESHVAVAAHVEKADYYVPAQEAGGGNATIFPMEDIIARLIARTCTQAGITGAFTELFNFSGCELYFEDFPELVGKTFLEISAMVEKGTPVGIHTKGKTILNPSQEAVLLEGDKLLVLEDDLHASRLLPAPVKQSLEHEAYAAFNSGGHVLILGRGRVLGRVVAELRDERISITAAGTLKEEYPSLGGIEFSTADIDDPFQLEALVSQADHVVLLSDEDLEEEEADAKAMMLLLRVQEIRTRLALSFNITMEIKLEKNKRLIREDGYADFVISSDISAMMVAQVAETPALVPVFKELLSRHGNELYLVPAQTFVSVGERVSHADLRGITLDRQAVYLGYVHPEEGKPFVVLNPPLQEKIEFCKGDGIVVVAESMEAISQIRG